MSLTALLLACAICAQDDPPVQFKRPKPEPARALLFQADYESMIHVFAFSPDGSRLAAGGGSHSDVNARAPSIKIWSVPDGAVLLDRSAPELGPIVDLVYSPDAGNLALATGSMMGGDGSFWIRDAIRGGGLLKLKGHTMDPYRLRFSPDGSRLLSCARDGSVRLWDRATGKELRAFLGEWKDIEPMYDAIFLPDGRTIRTIERSGALRSFDLSVPGDPGRVKNFEPKVGAAEFSSDASLLSVLFNNGEAHIFEAATLTRIARIPRTEKMHGTVVLSPEGRLAAQAAEDGVEVWELASERKLFTIPHAWGPLSFSPDGRRFATTFDFAGDLVLWDFPALLADGAAPGDFDAGWEALRSEDPKPGFRAAWTFIARGDEGAAALAERAFAPLPKARVAEILKALDDDRIEVRERARKDALAEGTRIREDLKRALAAGPEPQLKVILEDLLRRLDGPTSGVSDVIRYTRMAYALERIGSKAALAVLVRLSDAGLTTAENPLLKAAVDRMKRKP